ncbi:hypothetical protein SAMN02983003_2846 [Devosia enhydra]|uniref:Sulfatase N-terminal domain-containing protein n=1 Tax=Devosia enhydra TaxID=665118 RepID=A0A1K2HZX1_9HYPH|nr:sulfatase-like hydrolase/transferase [Devosia enhydra]SFZ85678.1 hypothetical protein SAMN02983003_2846 [Devosia enhydra]
MTVRGLLARLPALLVSALIIDLVLIQPNHPDAMTWGALRLFPLELPVILLTMIALAGTGWLVRAVRAVLVVVLVVIAVLKVADYGMFIAFNRPFNPLIDIHLVEAGLRLLSGTIGQVQATAIGIAAAITPFVLAWLLWWATGRWSRVVTPPAVRGVAVIGVVLASGLAIAEIGQARRAWTLPFSPPGAAFTARVGIERIEIYRALLADLEDFRKAADADPFPQTAGLFDRLEGADVLVIFVESYGRASIDNPLYAPTHRATLERFETGIAETGLGMRTGWLTSPISGGQSWLAHATLASGLRVDNQARYSAMLASPRHTLFHLANDAGYRTAAVMPAITLPWPEARLLGFQQEMPAAALGYKGDPFNWITMPDQFTLEAFDRLTAGEDLRRFTQIALISSHAPWTPVPQMVPWDEIGDGTIFNQWANSGDPPSVVWRDQDRVREQYRLTIDYALEAVLDYVRRHAEDDRVTIILGDHPPVAWVSGVAGGDVPIHMIGPPERLAAIADWGWTEGLIPGPDAPVWPMEAFRDRLISAYSSQVSESSR